VAAVKLTGNIRAKILSVAAETKIMLKGSILLDKAPRCPLKIN
jgi:hypothetical protein